jgi:hypothetical protein
MSESDPFNPESASSAEFEAEISIDMLRSSPLLYRDRLKVLLEGLPANQRVQDVAGGQAASLVEFCLDIDNLDFIEPVIDNRSAIDRILSSEPINEDTTKLLEALESAARQSLSGGMDENEKRFRQRLIFWLDYCDELQLAEAVFPDNVTEENNNLRFSEKTNGDENAA